MEKQIAERNPRQQFYIYREECKIAEPQGNHQAVNMRRNRAYTLKILPVMPIIFLAYYWYIPDNFVLVLLLWNGTGYSKGHLFLLPWFSQPLSSWY
jgi:hypothetical protein